MDRRIINTKKKLTNSLLLIIKEKNINKLLIYTDNYDEAYKELIESIPILKETIKFFTNRL